MNPFEFVIVLMMVIVIGGILRDRQRIKAGYPPIFGKRRHRHSHGEGKGGFGCALCGDGEDVEAVRADLDKLKKLEERVRVLERIVTDKRSALVDEIDSL